MPSGGDRPGPDRRLDQLATDAAEAVRRLKSMETRITRIDQAVQSTKSLPEKFADELKALRQKLGQLESGQKELRAIEQAIALRYDALEAGRMEAAGKTASLQRAFGLIEEILSNGLPSRPPTFSELKDDSEPLAFDPGPLGVAEPPPTPAPQPQSPRLGFLGGSSRYERDMEEWRRRDEAEREQYRQRVALRLQRLHEKQRLHARDNAERQAKANARNAVVAEMETAFAACAPEAVVWFVLEALERPEYPDWYPCRSRQYKVAFRPDRHDVFIELELPPLGVIPTVLGYQYLTGNAELLALPRPQTEVSRQYNRLIAGIALRTMSEILAATAPHAAIVHKVMFNGRVQDFDPATGRAFRPHLLSVSTTRADLNGLELKHVQPDICLAHLGARITPDPVTLHAVEPLEPFPALAAETATHSTSAGPRPQRPG